jgi:HEAT repeat protein
MQQTNVNPDRNNEALRLVANLKDADSDVRGTAAWKLREFPDHLDVVVPALIDSLTDVDWNVRFATISSLAHIGSQAKAAVPAITKRMLEDSDVGVRHAARFGLELIECTRVDWTRDPPNSKQIELWLEQLPPHAQTEAVEWYHTVQDVRRKRDKG